MIKILSISILLISMIHHNHLSAQDIFWGGFGNNDSWNNPANWNPARVPTNLDVVEIPNGNDVVFPNQSKTIKGLIISGQSSLTLADPNARLTIMASGSIGLSIIGRSDLNINSGTVTVQSSGTDAVYLDQFSTITNGGSLFINGYSEDGIHFDRNSTLTNNGLISIDRIFSGTDGYGINGESGSLVNNSSGEIFISNCNSMPSIPTMNIRQGFEYTDQGQSFLFPINCN